MDANMKQDFSTMHHAKQSGFLDYLCDWKKQHEEEYFSFRKGFEQIDGGDNSVYTRLFEMAKSCIPPYFFTMLMNVFGIEDTESEISEEEKALIDGIVDELYEFDGFVKVGVVDGEFEVDLVKEKGESDNPNVAYVRIKGIDEWWQSVPVQYRMVASLMFSGVAEKDYKYDRAQRMDTAINFRSQEFETSRKPRLMRGRRLVKIWTRRLLQIQ